MVKKIYLIVVLVCSIVLSGCTGPKSSKNPESLMEKSSDVQTETQSDKESIPLELKDYLAKSAQDQYENNYMTLGPVEGFAYVSNSGGIDIYYEGFWCGWLNILDFGDKNWKDNINFFVESNFSGTTGHYDLIKQNSTEYGNRYIYEGKRFPYAYSDTEWLVNGGIFTNIEEAYQESCDSYIVIYGTEGSRYGHCLYLEKYLINNTVYENLLEKISFTKEAFSEEIYKNKKIGEKNNYKADGEFIKLLTTENVKNINYQIIAGDLKYDVPKGTVAIRSDENEWILYCYSNAYGGGQQVGTIVISQNPHIEQSEEELFKQLIDSDYNNASLEKVKGGWRYSYNYQENLFNGTQKEELKKRSIGASLADTVCIKQHIVFLSDNKEFILQVRIALFD